MCIIKKEIMVIQINRKIVIDKAIGIIKIRENISQSDNIIIQIVITEKHERITVIIYLIM